MPRSTDVFGLLVRRVVQVLPWVARWTLPHPFRPVSRSFSLWSKNRIARAVKSPPASFSLQGSEVTSTPCGSTAGST